MPPGDPDHGRDADEPNLANPPAGTAQDGYRRYADAHQERRHAAVSTVAARRVALPSDEVREAAAPIRSLPATPSAALQLPAGYRIGHYELIRHLGSGGMGDVYLSRDLRLARLVAIKLLRKSTPAVRDRFLVEARTTARCNHENIVVIHEVGEHGEHPYLVLEYLEGQTLRAWWWANTDATIDGSNNELRTPLPPRRVAELMVPAVRALVCAHDHGIVHRDLKPDNIMLTAAGATKVLDFGIAKQLADPWTPRTDAAATSSPGIVLTAPGGLLGTLPYMSPEQLEGQPVDHRTDLWAMGIILFELALGYHPVAHRSAAIFLEMADLDAPMPSALDRAAELGPLGTIIDRCLIKNKYDRMDSARTLLNELESLLAQRSSIVHTRPPFAGLAPFQGDDADRFFGRDRDTAALLARVRSQPLVAVVGASGVGKSSLVRAGVIPALTRSGEGWRAHIVRPGRAPLAMLTDLLAALASPTEERSKTRDVRTPRELADEHLALQRRLREQPGYFGAAIRAWARRKRRRVLIFVDQFEELYTLGADGDERAAFTACLDGAADDASAPVRVVMSVRADFLDRLAEDRSFIDQVSRNLYVVAPLDRAGLGEALCRPVEDSGHSFEDAALVAEMLDALEGTQAALPLLQFAASALWQRRDLDRRMLTRAGYRDMGGVAGALAVHADTVLAAMPQPERALARTLLLRLVTPAQTRAPADLSELRALPGDPEVITAVIDRLVDARLLTIERTRDGADRVVELVHESLISGWPTLSRWLDECREELAFLARLRSAAQQWDQHDRSPGLLWRGQPVREADDWYTRNPYALSARERAFLQASLAHEQQEQVEKAEARAETARLREALDHTARVREAHSAEAWALAMRTVETDKIWSVTGHGLRNALGQVLGIADYLSYEFDSYEADHFDVDDTRRLLDRLLQASESATDMLINFMTWRRMQGGRMTPKPVSSRLRSLVARTFVLVGKVAQRKRIDLYNEVDSDLVIRADPEMAGAILRQLVGNALKFTPAGGEVTVSGALGAGAHAPHRAATAAAQTQVTVMVRDTGVGVDPDDLDKLFRSESLHSTLGTAEERGAGFGLALCSKIAALNHGSLTVDSTAGRGSTFALSLPGGSLLQGEPG
ncbi:protein kinase domain-containing protein [Haliangium sp.]|uniref:nSTAND1 domain-containing NTPase n=1 Tax=Haliangium sp. TaxID=2663208 RepID=UPI003D0BB9A5